MTGVHITTPLSEIGPWLKVLPEMLQATPEHGTVDLVGPVPCEVVYILLRNGRRVRVGQ